MLIKGKDLTAKQQAEVKRAFIYRWTLENKNKIWLHRAFGPLPTIEPHTDEQWIAEHAFHFVKDGSRLMFNRKHAEPHYLVD